MKIIALDLGRTMGVAHGDASLLRRIPRDDPEFTIGSYVLKGASPEMRAQSLARFLKRAFSRGKVDLVITEAPLNPAASKSSDATIGQLYLHGALQAVAGLYETGVALVPVGAVRKHFCGQSTAAPRRAKPRTMSQALSDREAINTIVLKRAILLGYLSEGSTDWDAANAAALWDYACAKYARAAPESLRLYGER